jgi:hypothetical protein
MAARLCVPHHRGDRPLCPSMIASNIATPIATDLRPLGGPEFWSGNPRSTTLTLSIPTTTDEDGCPTPFQPYTRVNLILRKLITLLEHKIFTWDQIPRLSPSKRPYLLLDEEILWAIPTLKQNPQLSPKSNPLSPQAFTSRLTRTFPFPNTNTLQAISPIHIFS